MKEFALRIAVTAIRAAAAFVEIFVKRGAGILLISCQSDEPTQDISDLAEAIERLPYPPHLTIMAGRMERNFGGAFAFAGKMLSMLKALAAARLVVIDAYCPAVSIPKKRAGQIVVQIWHAPEAIKKFSLQILDTDAGYGSGTAMILDMHQGYDYILCPAAATRPFFSEAFGYPESAFVKYGLPSLDRVGLMKRPSGGNEESADRAAARIALYKKYPALAGCAKDLSRGCAEAFKPGTRPLTVVYAPTFRDGASVDAEGLVRAFAKVADNQHRPLALILKLHPLDSVKGGGARAIDMENVFARGIEAKEDFCVITDAEFPLTTWYATADIIVTDYSGVAVEAAAAGMASYYYIYDMDEYAARRGLNVDLRAESIGKYAFADADLLAARVFADFSVHACDADGAVSGAGGFAYSSYDYGALAAFADKYIETPLTGNADRLAAFLTGL